ncbi:MAG TPA: YoaK family protein [Mucilaginibacter sp.]
MLRHIGHKRTNKHNVRLACMLSLTAGFVNGAGFLSFMVFTTNVTGHVATFAEKLAAGDLHTAFVIGMWMLLFLAGAFTSSIIINMIGPNQRFAYVIPIIVEILILLMVANNIDWWLPVPVQNLRFKAGSLLFAMGLQNAMVSMISGSVVRTTHLTGMFTDLGIELAGKIYDIKAAKSATLNSRILLRLIIIVSFFSGCIISALLYKALKLQVFYIPAMLLLAGMFYDIFRIKTVRYYRKIKSKYGATLSGHTE